MLQNTKTSTIALLFLICLLFGCTPGVDAQDNTQDCLTPDSLILRSDLTFHIGSIKKMETGSLHFGTITESEFSISWGSGRLEILYGKETKPSEAIKQFFNWVQEYAKSEFYIIRKSKLDSLLQIPNNDAK